MSEVRESPTGASAELFDEMTRETIARKVARMNTDELLKLLGHLILRDREWMP